MLNNIDIELGIDYVERRNEYDHLAHKIVYSGPLDALFDYKYGPLEYRTIDFDIENINSDDHQGTTVINLLDNSKWTRVTEHKHFLKTKCHKTILTKERPRDSTMVDNLYYPIITEENKIKHRGYLALANKYKIIIGGRIGSFYYADMNDSIKQGMDLANEI